MKIERKKLSQCSLEDLKRIYPRNVRCNDENGNTDCNIGCSRADTCPYLLSTKDDFECAYIDLIQADSMEDVKKAIALYGDIVVRLQVK